MPDVKLVWYVSICDEYGAFCCTNEGSNPPALCFVKKLVPVITEGLSDCMRGIGFSNIIVLSGVLLYDILLSVPFPEGGY